MLHNLIACVDGRVVVGEGEGVQVAADAVAGADGGVFFVVFVELPTIISVWAGYDCTLRGDDTI
jgi:hypothetical protein